MPSLVLRNFSDSLHQRLRIEAELHHRSMNREAIAILEKELDKAGTPKLPTPVKGKKPVNPQWIAKAIRKARDGRA